MIQARAVIFDIDGTLLLSNDAHAQAFVDAAAELGIEANFTRIRRLIGKGGDKLIREAFGFEKSSKLGKELDELKGEIFKKRYLPGLQPTPGARALVQRLNDEGIKLAVATSGSKEDVVPVLKQSAVEGLIRIRVTADDVAATKPEPDIILAALRKLDCPDHNVLMIGDTPYDVEAAQRAGIRIIGVRCGGWSDADLHGAAAVYDDPADVLRHYDETFVHSSGGGI